TDDIDRFVLRLLAKDAGARPGGADAIRAALASAGRIPSIAPSGLDEAALEELERALLMDPGSAEPALELEAAIEQGAPPERVAAALRRAATVLEDDPTQRRSLLLRAARLFERDSESLERAEEVYQELLELDEG